MRRHFLAIAMASAILPGPGAGAEGGASTAPKLAQLRSARVRGLFDGKTVQLKGGVYEGPPYEPGGASRPRAQLLRRLTATGDLDGRPGEERLVFLSASTGGSGEDVLLAAFGLRKGKVENLGTALVGNRVKLRGLAVDGRTVILDVLEAGPKDAMCCPTQLARRSYRLEAGMLAEVGSEVTGTLSLATISGAEWTLEEMDGKPLPKGARPPTLQVGDGAVSGFGGCNRYRGGIEERSPGSVSIGKLASTMMACLDPQTPLETRFLRELALVGSYTFLEGRLALPWEEGGRRGVLLFRR